MTERVEIRSGNVAFSADLDFERGRWTSVSAEPEGDFPFTVHVGGKRYELYSDHRFAEVEGGLD
jgi:hypothetical protein